MQDKFIPVLNFYSEMGEWKKFIKVNERTIYLYFTQNSIGLFTKQLDTDDSSVTRLQLNLKEKHSDAFVFVRCISPSKIECKVSHKENGKELEPTQIFKLD
uniref:Uncharacterized protein n=1 Tax=uncultured bacterium contig00062 TaxID=1181545 RepID=A0A806K178_9BACT|nr:hypothetical protein [uncultured bacterium contig00062]